MQTEVGTIDVVNTFSAARSVYGWMGGVDGLRYLLQRVLNPFGERLKSLELDRNLRLMPLQAHVLTSQGPLVAHLDDAQESFGGDIRTQVIGMTICALAHECSELTAVRLFTQYLLPYLFGDEHTSLLLSVIKSKLLENETLHKILNEGAARGLNNLFIEIAAEVNLPEVNSAWGPTKRDDHRSFIDYGYSGPMSMIGGLLRWFAQGGGLEYRTRSSAVARLAAYLKAIGYKVGDIHTWNGHGAPPVAIHTRSVTLVLGGSSETDPFMEQIEKVMDNALLLHYQHRTTGAMLLTALGHVSYIPPETLQDDFERVFDHIGSILKVEYTCKDDAIIAKYRWRDSGAKPTSTATRLASIYFSHIAEHVAPCFDRIAKEDYLKCVMGRSSKVMQPDAKKLGRFRAITASVAISIISRFASETFETVHHATRLNLSLPGPLTLLCRVLDQDDFFPMATVVALLASVHAGIHTPEEMPAASTEIIAWRQGIYSVVPSLLLDMKVSRESPQPVCFDRFWANVNTEYNGSIKSSNTEEIQRYEVTLDEPFNIPDLSSAERLAKPYLGLPDLSAPDSPLYLSLGAPLHYGDPHLCFIGWFQGSVAGAVGITDALKAVLMSRVEPDICPGHEGGPKQVLNVKTSVWAREPLPKPIHRQHSVFIPVGGDHCWTIFLAAQTVNQGGRIVFRCPTCADEKFESQGSNGSRATHDSRPFCFVGFCESGLNNE